MEPGSTWSILIAVICLILSAFFSAMQAALLALSRQRHRYFLDKEVEATQYIFDLVEHPNRSQGTLLIANILTNMTLGVILAWIFHALWGLTGAIAGLFLAIVIVVIFGEIIPKSLGAERAEKLLLRWQVMLRVMLIVFAPLYFLLSPITNGILKVFGIPRTISEAYPSAEEIKSMIDASHEEGVLKGEEKAMIYNVFEFGDSQADDIMTPRTDVISIDVTTPYEEILSLFRTEQFSRMPVYRETIDDIIGVLYIKDIVLLGATEDNFDVEQIMREPYFTYEFVKSHELFRDMREKRVPIAIVLDEYGGTSGIVAMEDLVEAIVGDINDEYDDQEEEIRALSDNEFLVEGSTRIEIVNEVLELGIESEEFDSIGGFVLGELGGLPEEGEELFLEGVTYKVEKIEKNRIEELKITR